MYMQLLEQYPTHMIHFADNATKQYASKLVALILQFICDNNIQQIRIFCWCTVPSDQWGKQLQGMQVTGMNINTNCSQCTTSRLHWR